MKAKVEVGLNCPFDNSQKLAFPYYKQHRSCFKQLSNFLGWTWKLSGKNITLASNQLILFRAISISHTKTSEPTQYLGFHGAPFCGGHQADLSLWTLNLSSHLTLQSRYNSRISSQYMDFYNEYVLLKFNTSVIDYWLFV